MDAEKIADQIIKNKERLLNVVSIVLTIVIIIAFLTWISSVLTRESRNCDTMNDLYSASNTSNDPQLASVYDVYELENVQVGLQDFYIKTAYNCCSAGDYKNSFVSTCALKNCISQGARGLDFEIYSISNNPVIATSSTSSCKIKETYNSLPFEEAMETVASYAFNSGFTSQWKDPIIFHFRFRTCPNNIELYGSMANILMATFNDRLLSSYNFKYARECIELSGNSVTYNSLGDGIFCPMSELQGKVVIICESLPPALKLCTPSLETPEKNAGPCTLYDLINGVGNGQVCYSETWDNLTADVAGESVQDEISKFKTVLGICTPTVGSSPINPNFLACKTFGIQMTAMCFQNFDENLEVYDLFFNGLDGSGNPILSDASGATVNDVTRPCGFMLKPSNKRPDATVFVVSPDRQTNVAPFADTSTDFNGTAVFLPGTGHSS